VTTALPWLADQLITDIFAGLAVLALHLLMFRADALHRPERWVLVLLLAFAVASHNATLAVILAVLAAAAVAALFRRDLVPWSSLVRPLAAVGLGAVMLLAANVAVSGRLAWTPGGASLIFGRFVQDGIVKRYLAEHCPDPRLRLCDHQAEIPDNAEMFFWGRGVFDRLGGFTGLATEMETIVRETLVAYPWMQVETAARATLQQLVLVRTGDGIISWLPHTYGIIERFTPQLVPAMKAARQQQDEFGFDAINRLHIPVTLGAMLLLPFVMALAWRRRVFADVGLLATSAMLAILANAFICGALSNPHDRYGARIAWIAVLVIVLVILRWPRPARSP